MLMVADSNQNLWVGFGQVYISTWSQDVMNGLRSVILERSTYHKLLPADLWQFERGRSIWVCLCSRNLSILFTELFCICGQVLRRGAQSAGNQATRTYGTVAMNRYCFACIIAKFSFLQRGTESDSNQPGPRYILAYSIDRQDNIWIFGGRMMLFVRV